MPGRGDRAATERTNKMAQDKMKDRYGLLQLQLAGTDWTSANTSSDWAAKKTKKVKRLKQPRLSKSVQRIAETTTAETSSN
jgi:hypothetical protein